MGQPFVAIAAFFALAVSILGFIGIWVRVGIKEGSTDTRLTTVEKKAESLQKDVDDMAKNNAGFEKEMSGFMSEIRTSLHFIFQGIDELKKKQEKDDAEKK